MASHIVRVAAQNLAFSVYDTNDLSTIRGGGLVLLKAVEGLDTQLGVQLSSYEKLSYNKLYVGASELLGTLDVPAGEENAVTTKVHDALAATIETIDGFADLDRAFTIAVAVEPIPQGQDGLAVAEARADARMKIRQYRELSFALPAPAADAGEAGGSAAGDLDRPCRLDHVRPAAEEDAGDLVSRFVAARRRFGRTARQSFYDEELSREPDILEVAAVRERLRAEQARGVEFAQTLLDLTLGSEDALELPPALSGKIAILHLDGNAFQKRRKTLMTKAGADGVTAFSRFVRERQTRLLARLLGWALDPQRRHMIRPPTKDDEVRRIRIETLLWGGDEMAFAVPVWAAWSLMREIEDELFGWTLPEDDAFTDLEQEERRLTHAIGLAFVNHKAPIRQSRDLAQDLCEDAKRADRKRTIVSAFAAETVELPRGGLETARARLLLDSASTRQSFAFARAGDQQAFHNATLWVRTLKRALERSQAMKLAFEARQRGLVGIGQESRPATSHQTGDQTGAETWATWASAEITRVVREKKARDAVIAGLGLDGTETHLPFAPPTKGSRHPALPLMMALHLWDYVEPLGPNCHDGGA